MLSRIIKSNPTTPHRSVPNPARKAVEKEVHAARVHLRKLRESYGATAIDYIHGSTSTDPDFEIAEEKIRMEIDKATNHIKKLKARRDSLPARVTVADAQKGQEMVKLSTERKHLTNVLKMVAYQTESDLVELIRPHYNRVEDEGRTFIQMALQDTADIEPTEDQLRITLAPLSSPHRSRVLEALCEALNKTNTLFPGTQLQMRYLVAPSSSRSKKRTGFRQTMSGVLNLRAFNVAFSSIPTAPTNISFSNNQLQICEGAEGSIKLTLPAPEAPNEPLCCLLLSKRREPHACRYSSSCEYRHGAVVPAGP